MFQAKTTPMPIDLLPGCEAAFKAEVLSDQALDLFALLLRSGVVCLVRPAVRRRRTDARSVALP